MADPVTPPPRRSVFGPPQISTSGMSCGGYQKCAAMTRPGVLHLVDERARRLSARGGEHRRRRADLVEPAEQIALQGQVLGHGLDDELGRRRIGEPGGGGDPPHDRLDRRPLHQLMGDERVEAGADPLQGALEAVAGAAHQHHLLAGHGEELGNAMADDAIADHRQRLEARGDLQFSH